MASQTKKKVRLIQDCWSWDGTILIKNNVGRIIPVHSTEDLEKITPFGYF